MIFWLLGAAVWIVAIFLFVQIARRQRIIDQGWKTVDRGAEILREATAAFNRGDGAEHARLRAEHKALTDPILGKKR